MEAYVDTLHTETVAAPPITRRARATSAPVREARLPYSRWATAVSFLLPDLLSLTVVVGVLFLVKRQFEFEDVAMPTMLPVAGIALLVAYALFGLYNVVAMHPAQELRTVAVVTTMVFVAYAFLLVLVGVGGAAMLLGLLAAWLFTLSVVLVSRALARVFFGRAPWWGAPVVVLASNGAGDAVVRTLDRWPEIGLRPVALLHNEVEGEEIDSRLALEMTRLAPALATTHKIPYAIVAMPDLDQRDLINLVGRCSKFFKFILVVPEVTGTTVLWTTRPSFKGMMGYGVQHAERARGALVVKRTIDFIAAFIGGVMLAPVLLIIAVLIKLDSPGPVFFRQNRMTRDGLCFRVLKFRSMHVDADQKLRAILEEYPELRAEYEEFHKLREDPRVTRVGRVLRRYSLDELSQLWNVLRGQLSLVGPRAYMPSELSKMDSFEHVILQNRPGITGLWQVSGRNSLSFEERLQLDVHYVYNWTPWLDLYILARTVPVVLTGEGAV